MDSLRPPAGDATAGSAGAAGAGTRDFARSPLGVGILLWPSFPLMSLTGIVESLRHAGDHGDASYQRYARWDIIGAPGARIASSCGIAVRATAAHGAPRAHDYLFVIGGLLRDLAGAPPAHRAHLRAAARAGVSVVSVCTGSFILAEEGLLEGVPVCVHPYHRKDFETAHPRHRIRANRDFETCGQITTVLGGVSILSFMARIIERHFGPDRAAKTVHQMTLPTSDGFGALERAARSPHVKISDPRIQRALVTLDAQATRNPGIADLARALGLSERHFLRLFRQQVGRAPKQYLVDTKLRAAVWMLRHTTRSVTSIAYEAGFSSGANLADHCQKRLGNTPTTIRNTGPEAGTGPAANR